MAKKRILIILLFMIILSAPVLFSEPDEGRDLNESFFESMKRHVLSTMKKSTHINLRDIDGKTPLYYAASSGNIEIFNILLKQGADINARDNNEVTILHGAAARNDKNPEMFEIIVKNGLDINVKDKYKRTPVTYSASFGNISALKALIELGADLNARDNNNITPLIEAAEKIGDYEIVKLLKDNGADINAVNNIEKTALMVVKNPKGVESLILCGANIEKKDMNGNTALVQSVSYDKRSDKIAVLVENGAKINVKSGSGKTLLECLKNNKNMNSYEKEIAEQYLTAKGAK